MSQYHIFLLLFSLGQEVFLFLLENNLTGLPKVLVRNLTHLLSALCVQGTTIIVVGDTDNYYMLPNLWHRPYKLES